MAVARKSANERKKELKLSDGQTINAVVREGNLTQGDREANAELFDKSQIARDRLALLRKRSIEATPAEYKSRLNEYDNFKKSLAGMVRQIDEFIVRMLASWDYALTQQDEDNHIYIPLTLEGLATALDDTARLEIAFAILTPNEEEEERKNDSSANSSAAMPTPKENLEASQASTLDT